MDLNKAMVIGRLTRDPEMRTTANGINVCTFSVATNSSFNQEKPQVEYHNIVTWRKLAEIANQYLRKGSQVYIEGRLQTRTWDGQDGKKNYRTEIVADQMIMLGGKSSGSAMGGSSSSGSASAGSDRNDAGSQGQGDFISESDIPTINQDADEEITVEDIPF